MLVLGQTLWIILIFYIDFFLPLGCKAAIETKNGEDDEWMRMENDEDSHDRFNLKTTRRLLAWGDNEPSWRKSSYNSSDSSNTTALTFVIIFIVITILAALIKCCIKLASEEADETSRITVHPPPSSRSYTQSSYVTSRPLAPPMTSRSVILLPEERNFHTLFIGIENPNYIPSTTNRSDTPSVVVQEQRNNNPIDLFDLPPDYDSVVKAGLQNTSSENGINIPNAPQEYPLPKYDDSNKKK